MQTEIFLAEKIRESIKENLEYKIKIPKTANQILREVIKEERGIIFNL